MVQYFPASSQSLMRSTLSQSLGKGLSDFATSYYANKAIENVMNEPGLRDRPLSERYEKLEQALRPFGEYGQNVLAKRLGVEQQRAQEAEAAKAEALRKKQGAFAKRMFPNMPGIEDASPDILKAAITQQMKNEGKLAQFQQEAQMLGIDLPGMQTQQQNQFADQPQEPMTQPSQMMQQPVLQPQPGMPTPSPIGRPAASSAPQGQPLPSQGQFQPGAQPHDPKKVLAASLIAPNAARIMQSQNEQALELEKERNRRFTQERDFHSKFTQKAEEAADKLRESIPRKENALAFARDAVESNQVDYFSPNKLADATGIDLFRTSKGAELITAGKENLLSNMNRVSAKAQNVWFEQRLNSQFPKIGQSKEANLTTQEMIESELMMDKAYLKAFDAISEQDQKDFGYVKKDVEKRARDAVKVANKEIFQRAAYRIRELEESEKGINELKKNVGKPVLKGTPFTLANAKLFYEKYGKDTAKKAKELGYMVPTIEDFKLYQMTPREFGERFE